jgi:ketosteroid isomerase-like protein
MKAIVTCLLIAYLIYPAGSQAGSDREELVRLLHGFLAGASENSAQAHDRFWAEDLVYTSSDGTRFGKSEIMDGLAAEPDEDAEPATVYTAEEIQVNEIGDAAIVAFKLVGTSAEEVKLYFNTGTFFKRDGRWQAVGWQATKIPRED